MEEKRIAILGGPFSFAFYCLPVFRIVDTARIGSLSSRAYGYGIGCICSLNERERGGGRVVSFFHNRKTNILPENFVRSLN